MGIDKPDATVIVDDLEGQGLVRRRRPHPTDRRAELVEVTTRGGELAQRADRILASGRRHPASSLSVLWMQRHCADLAGGRPAAP